MQSKRRAHSVLIDHLTPPMTTADGYGELAQLMQLVDEYYQIEMLDPSKMPLIQKQIWELIQKINLDEGTYLHCCCKVFVCFCPHQLVRDIFIRSFIYTSP